MKRFVKLISACLAVCIFAFSLSGCSFLMDYSSDSAKYLETDFNKMGYTRPNLDRYYELSENIEEACTVFYHALRVNDYFNEMVDIYNSMYAMSSLLSVYTALDASDEYYASEYLYIRNEINDVKKELNRIAGVIKNSPCAYMIEFYNGEDIWDYFDSADEGYAFDEEYEKLSDRENELVSEYNTLAAGVFTVSADSVPECSDGRCEDILYDGVLTLDEISALYDRGCINAQRMTELQREIYVLMNDAYGEVYLELIDVRNQIAENRGFESYAEYAYKELYFREYSEEDVETMREYVKTELVPLYNALLSAMNYGVLAEGDEFMSEAYKSISSIMKPILGGLSEDMLDVYEDMLKSNRYSFEYSETKVDYSFTTLLNCYNVPYLFCSPSENATGYDFFTVVHEFGHYFAFSTVPVTESNVSDLDSQEVFSQSLELIFADRMGEIFTENDISVAQYTYVLTQILSAVIEGCKMDEFQSRVYSADMETVSDVNKIYGDIMYEYGTEFYDIGNGESLSWIDIVHNFIAPYYYISYASSAVASLELWASENSEEIYFEFVENSENLTFLENIEECGLGNPFSADTLNGIKSMIESKCEVSYEV